MHGSPQLPPASSDLGSLPPPVLEALDRVRGGRGVLLILSGGGRATRAQVLRAMESAATRSGWETLPLRAHPLDRGVPYGALHPWLAKWARAPEASSERTKEPEVATRYSMPLVGLIAGLPSTSPRRDVGSGRSRAPLDPLPSPPSLTASPLSTSIVPLAPPLSPQMLRAELTELVHGRTSARSAVITVEDADFLDPASRLWFSFLASRLGGHPLAVVLSLDPEDAQFKAWEEQFSGGLAAWCHLPGGEPPAARGALQSRLGSFPARTVTSLLTAVLAGPDASREIVREVAAMSEAELELAISPAVDAGLLELRESLYATRDPSLFPDLLGAAKPPQLLSTHRGLATALEKRLKPAPGSTDPLLFRICEHWAKAAEAGRGVPSLLSAAREAERWGSPELADEKLLAAVVLAQTDPTAHGREVEERVLYELAQLRARAGRPAEAAEVLRRAIPLAKSRGARAVQWAKYEALLGDCETRMGGHPEERLRQALTQVQGRSSDVEALLLRSLSYYYVERGRIPAAIQEAERSCELADKGRDVVLQVRCHTTANTAYIFGGHDPDRSRFHLHKALEIGRSLKGTAEEGILVNAMDGLSLVECALGNEQESIRWGEESLKAARQFGFGTGILLVLGNLAEHYVHLQDFDRARELADELGAFVKRMGLPEVDPSSCQLLLVEGRIAAGKGEVTLARDRLNHLIDLAEKGVGRYFLSQALVHLVVLSAKSGDREGARRYFRRLEREGLLKALVEENRHLLQEVEPLIGGEGLPKF